VTGRKGRTDFHTPLPAAARSVVELDRSRPGRKGRGESIPDWTALIGELGAEITDQATSLVVQRGKIRRYRREVPPQPLHWRDRLIAQHAAFKESTDAMRELGNRAIGSKIEVDPLASPLAVTVGPEIAAERGSDAV
jgi:hypothetical protein